MRYRYVYWLSFYGYISIIGNINARIIHTPDTSFYPVLSYAQYMDKTQCKISFSSHANQAGKLEYTQDGIIYRFTPESNAWKITIKNNTNKNARINWEKGSFIINGKLPESVCILLHPMIPLRMLSKKNLK